jgi:phosphoglycerol transferase
MLLFAYMVWRNAGLHAVVMADEWYYSSFARLVPLADATLPSYLYLLAAKSTSACGTGFLECARLLNVIAFLGAAPLIYGVARRFVAPRFASLIALCAVAGPVNSYTAYFMPEALYFTGFWALTLALFRFRDAPTSGRAAVLGCLLGAMTLIKLHGFFLLPAVVLFMLFATRSRADGGPAPSLGKVLGLLALVVGLTLGVRFAGGYLLAGSNGLNLSGRLYAQASNAGAHAPLLQLLKLAMFNLRGHLYGMALLFGMPLAAMLACLSTFKRAGQWRTPAGALALYTLLVLGSLIAVTVLFTASVAGAGQESNFRLHMRYYNFCLPLLLIVAAVAWGEEAPGASRAVRIVLALPIAATILFAVLTLWQPYTPSFVDSPELQGMTAWRQGFYLLSSLSLLSVLAWAHQPRWGIRLFFGGFMPVFLVIAGYAINHEVARGGASNQYDQAGTFARNFLSADERSHLAIVTDDGSGMFRTQFYTDDARVFQHMAPQGSLIAPNALPASIEWVLFVGKYALPKGAVLRGQARSFSLVELSPQSADHFSVAFAKPDGGMLASTRGLSGLEPWGRWSDGATVQLLLGQPLPKKFKLGMLVEAYGPNDGQQATVRVGEQRQQVRISKAKQWVELEFSTTEAVRAIEITVPQPTSPHDLNGSEDRRQLGIGFTTLRIDELP